MNDDYFLDQLLDAQQVVVTPHALRRGFDETEIGELARQLAGVVYFDTQEQTYHLVSDDIVLIMNVRDGKRIVITAYTLDEPSRYQSIRYRILRG